jgi:hypothetical protein
MQSQFQIGWPPGYNRTVPSGNQPSKESKVLAEKTPLEITGVVICGTKQKTRIKIAVHPRLPDVYGAKVKLFKIGRRNLKKGKYRIGIHLIQYA